VAPRPVESGACRPPPWPSWSRSASSSRSASRRSPRAGRFVYRTAEERALHGGKTEDADATYWLKGEALLHLEPKRVDDAQRGEDPATAGRLMLALSLVERTASSTYPRLDF